MRVLSFAKVNLWLRVVGKREDGFHDIETFFHTISLHDELQLEPSDELSIVMNSPEPWAARMPTQEDNIAFRAALLLAERTDAPGARIEISKNIPLSAGLAGGSGNAAAVLTALRQLWDVAIDHDELMGIAASLGSDVPFMLVGGTALGRGRGDLLERVPDAPSLWFVLGIADRGLSTGEVYERWRPEHSGTGDLGIFRDILVSGDPDDVAAAVRNDLEPAALELRPELAAQLETMTTAGALKAFISGSGPTVVGLARSQEHAASVAARLSDTFDRVQVVRSHPPGQVS